MSVAISCFVLVACLSLLLCAAAPAGRVAALRRSSPWLAGGGLAAAALLALGAALDPAPPARLALSLADEGALADLPLLRVDALSATMLLLIGFLGWAVARFSCEHLRGEPGEGRYHKWLCATIGSISLVVVSGNLILFTLAWISTSLSLHQLLGFYRERPAARLAARKKFLLSRLGDLCLIGAAVWAGRTYGTVGFEGLFEAAAALEAAEGGRASAAVDGIPLLLVLGALLKSAQFPFHTWLPDTLETPTPVSALMHAGIINAGGYLVIRLSPLVALSEPALAVLASAGALTAFAAGMVMLAQTSVKKQLAFSTVAQMGFMMLQCGLGAFALAALHIVAHSLYKAHAFLASGFLPQARPDPQRPSLAALLALLLAAMGAFLGIGQLTGAYGLDRPGNWLLGMAATLALAQLAQPLWPRRRWGGLALFGMAAFAALYGLLAAAAKRVFDTAEMDAGAPIPVAAGAGALLALGFAIQEAAARRPDWPLLKRLYVHVSHGFYANVLANRLLQRREVGAHRGRPGFRPVEDGWKPAPNLASAVEEACSRIGPLWPLDRFVAANPFLGFSERSFFEAASLMRRTVGASLAWPARTYAKLLEEGAIGKADLEAALREAEPDVRRALERAGAQLDPEGLRSLALAGGPARSDEPLPTFAAFIDGRPDGYWQRFIAEDLSRRCAALADRTVSTWHFPFRAGGLYEAWRQSMPLDANLDAAGLKGFRRAAKTAPRSPEAAVALSLEILGVPGGLHADFMHATLFSLRGWAGHGQRLRHEARLRGGDDRFTVDLLALLLVSQAFLFQAKADATTAAAWRERLERANRRKDGLPDPELALRCVLQDAMERAARRPLARELSRIPPMAPEAAKRPELQAAFCIDVRSENVRHALESLSPDIETIGFAGFFGLPVELEGEGTPLCPALLAPTVRARAEGPRPTPMAKLADAWKRLAKAFPGCFPFVEAAGLSYAWRLARESAPGLPFPRTAPIEPTRLSADLDPEAKTELAEAILKGLGLDRRLGKIVLLVGHGSSARNNPHAAALDCGACGGRKGNVNARLVASLLNDPDTRRRLKESRGIDAPKDTVFLAALHDTATDELILLPDAEGAEPNAATARRLRRWLDQAANLARARRGPSLGLALAPPSAAAYARFALDWSQTRPEWGLAGNAAFVAAPRRRTRGLDLGGQAFLHEYAPDRDPDGKSLALILTAPAIVASWINLQYYASAIDPVRFGADTKTIHNIAAGLGVLAGNGGDLKTGLPRQSIEAPDRLVHRPRRLDVFVEASPERLEAALADNESIRNLVSNRWVRLYALPAQGGPPLRRLPEGGWQPESEREGQRGEAAAPAGRPDQERQHAELSGR